MLATQGPAQPCESGTMSPLLSLGIATRKGFIVFFDRSEYSSNMTFNTLTPSMTDILIE